MPYCSYCAAAIDQSQVFCPRCGRPVPVAPSPVVAGGASDVRPSSVTIAVVLLAICLVIGISMFAFAMAMYPRRAAIPIQVWFQSAVTSLLWVTCLIFLWQRQDWARYLAILLIVLNAGYLAVTMIRVSSANAPMWTFAAPVIEDIVRVVAAVMLFQPQSNSWFKK